MKDEVRVLGIDDAPFDKFKDKTCLVVGAFYRGGSMLEGVLTTHVKIDGTEGTQRIAEMVNRCKFKPQIQAIFMDGLNMAGFNMIDIHKLNKQTRKPVIVIVRRKPKTELIKATLEKLGMGDRIALLERAGEVIKHKGIFFQKAGITTEEAREFINVATTHSLIPEAIRIAHIIGAGVVKGESRGKA